MLDIVRNKYVLVELVGHGTYGKIYKSQLLKTKVQEQFFAIKFCNEHELSKTLIKHESTMLNYLNRNHCANIPIMHWYGIHDGMSTLVMPFYECTLQKYCQERCIDVQGSEIIIQQLSNIIRDIHNLNVIHRDIKPDNFMLDASSHNWKLIDFGLATLDLCEPDDEVITKSIIGNIHYMSYNVHLGHRPTKHDDLISLNYIKLFIHLSREGKSLPWVNEGSHEIIAKMKHSMKYL